MRILQVITKSCLGGAQSVVVNLSNTLVSRGHEVAVTAGTDDGKMWDLLDAEVSKFPCRSLQRSVSPIKDMTALWQLHRIYREYKPDVIHLHSSKAGMLGRIAFPKNKIVYTVHGFDSIRLAFRSFLPIERFMQRRCRAIVGVSEHDLRTMKECGIHRNVTYIHNGILEAVQDPALSWEVPSMRYKKVVLCIARLSPPKRHDLFLKVAARLPEYAFVWIGNQDDVTDHPENVFMLGNQFQASRFCQLADLFMLPSDYEGLPMVIIEAMSYGLPVVASNVGGVSEIVRDYETGFAVDNDVEAFVEKIRYILEDENAYDDMSRKSMEYFRNDLTIDCMLDKYMVLYQQIVDWLKR